jgi:hypothetical protein
LDAGQTLKLNFLMWSFSLPLELLPPPHMKHIFFSRMSIAPGLDGNQFAPLDVLIISLIRVGWLHMDGLKRTAMGAEDPGTASAVSKAIQAIIT